MATARDLAMSNLLRVFGERDVSARRAAIADTYADDVVFSDPEGDVVGHAAIDAKVEALLAISPGFVFSAVEPATWSPASIPSNRSSGSRAR